MADPETSLHYTPNSNITASGQYAPGADGFNLADASSVGTVNALPAGVKGLVYLGMGDGVTSAFQAAVTPYIGNPNVYGFYLEDEPDPTGQYGPLVTAANLKAESDWIHANDPGAKTFIVMMNLGTPTNPSYANTYNPANTDIDLFGLDPYPVRPQFSGGVDYSVIPDAVSAANAAGIPTSQIVPVYQAFGGGGYSSWTLPTASQEQQILSTWGSVVPNPAFDYAYSWGSQDGDTALSNSPALQQVFATHNAGSSTSQSSPSPTPTPTPAPTPTPTPAPTPTPTPSSSVLKATDNQGVTATIPVITSGTSSFTAPLAGTVSQSVASGVDTVSATAAITSETLMFGSGTQQMNFAGSQSLTVYGGSGADTVTAAAGKDTFTAGTGTLTVTGGSGRDAYVFHAGDGLLTVENFSRSKGDTLTVDKALQASVHTSSDGHGGTMLSFGTAGQAIDLANVSSFSTSRIQFA